MFGAERWKVLGAWKASAVAVYWAGSISARGEGHDGAQRTLPTGPVRLAGRKPPEHNQEENGSHQGKTTDDRGGGELAVHGQDDVKAEEQRRGGRERYGGGLDESRDGE